jgi:putative transposase
MINAPRGREHLVKKSKPTENEIVFGLNQAELGTRVEEVCRKIGINGSTF